MNYPYSYGRGPNSRRKPPETGPKQMNKYENQLYGETMKPFINSGHAFVCFDSVNSLNVINKHFRLTPTQHFKIFLIGIKDKFSGFLDWISGREAAS